MKKRILIATTTFGEFCTNDLFKKLEDNGCEVVRNELGRKYTENELSEIVKDFDGIIAGTEKYSSAILGKSKKLKVISRLGVGTDNIDLMSAEKNKIRVLITATSPGLAVAELSLGLMLGLLRRIPFQNQEVKSKVWSKHMGCLLSDKTLGIIGLGSIGKQFLNLTRGFNFKILAYDKIRDQKFAEENNISYCSLDYLLRNSNVISIHLNLNKKTKNLLNKEKLRLIKPDSILINTSRGGIVDEVELYNLLNQNLIYGVGLDVFEDEPYIGPLSKMTNAILTPHIGSYAREIRAKMEKESVKNLLKGLYEK